MLGSLLVHQAPLAVGSPAPAISLTADDGAWFRSSDYEGRRAVVLAFFGSPRGAAADQLRALEGARDRVEALGGLVRGVSHLRPERLAAARRELDLGYTLLYDLLAIESRRWHQSRRRPQVRDGVAVVDRSGRVAWHRAGTCEVSEILDVLGALARESRDGTGSEIGWAAAEELLAGGAALVDVRSVAEFASHHHPDARSVPLDELPHRLAELRTLATVVCVCATGEDGARAAALLGRSGVEARWVRRGMAAWSG